MSSPMVSAVTLRHHSIALGFETAGVFQPEGEQ
jgi:hypothetical protein